MWCSPQLICWKADFERWWDYQLSLPHLDTSKAAGWHSLPRCQYLDSILWEKVSWYNCVILFEPCRRRRRNSRLDLRSHLDWWARMRLIELSHKSADRMSEAEKELKLGSWRRELAHDWSGKEMIWGYIVSSESDLSPPTSLEKQASTELFHLLCPSHPTRCHLHF